MLHMTALVIFRSLFPAGSRLPVGATGQFPARAVAPEEVGPVLANLHCLLKPDLSLEIFFPACHRAAAPFVLFRLKREGYSRCTAVASAEGLLVRAVR